MVLFFTSTLITSAVALVLLLSIKRYELNTGRVLGASLRPYSGRFFHAVSLWVERIIPTLARIYSKRIWNTTLGTIHRLTALVVVRVEGTLERTLHTLRHTTNVRHTSSDASPFLREVSEHKRKLLKGDSTPVRGSQE